MSGRRIAWIARSFLDYRVPVFQELDRLSGGGLHVFYCADYVPARLHDRVRDILGVRAVGLRGEWRLGREDRGFMANRNVSLRVQPGLGRLVHACRPDVLVCDGFFKWTIHGLVQRLLHHTPLVITYERTAHTERCVQSIRTKYRRFVVRHTDAMACSGSSCAAYAQSLGMEGARITTGQMVADTDFFASAAAAHDPTDVAAFRELHGIDGVMYLHVGRIIRLKGCFELLHAWARFAASGIRGTLVFAGTGEQESELLERCAQLGLNGSVRIIGAVPYKRLPRVYASADVLVSATLEDNWSLVVPEAMASGLPVLCSRYNGCHPELIRESVNGWVFDPQDKQAFAAALQRVGEARDRLPEMGRESARLAKSFSPAHAAGAIHAACGIAMGVRR